LKMLAKQLAKEKKFIIIVGGKKSVDKYGKTN